MTHRKFYLALALLSLMSGAALRLSGLGYLNRVIDIDEAYYGMDAVSLLREPRFVPFFEGNNGRESLWMYVLLPALKVLGPQPFALRITAVMVGILTLAAVYALARELFDNRVATWTLAMLAVLYWPVHLSHIAFRVNLYPMMGALALACLLRAYRKSQVMNIPAGIWRIEGVQRAAPVQLWAMAGIFTGLLLYTYLAAWTWVTVIGLMLTFWFIRWPEQRVGTLVAAGVALLIALPMLAYLVSPRNTAGGRLNDVVLLSPGLVVKNVIAWVQVWLWKGSPHYFHNFQQRPVLDIPLLIFCLAGIVAFLKQHSWQGRWLLLLALVSVAPSLLSDEAPHYLRAMGLIVPIAITGGAGAAWLENQLTSRLKSLLVMTLLLILIFWSAARSWSDFWQWAQDFRFPDWRQNEQAVTWALVDYLRAPLPEATPAYYFHGDQNPYLGFLIDPFELQRLEIYEFPDCTISPQLPFEYIGRLMHEPELTTHIGTVTLLKQIEATGTRYDYGIYRVTAPEGTLVGEAGEALRVMLVEPLPEVVLPGESLALHFRVSAIQPVSRPYTLFMHLYPLDRIEILAQHDAPLCPEFAPSRWPPDRSALVTRMLTLPETLLPGGYRIALGIYDSESYQRLPVNTAAGDYFIVGWLTVK